MPVRFYQCNYNATYKLYKSNTEKWTNSVTLVRFSLMGHGTGYGLKDMCLFAIFKTGEVYLLGESSILGQLNLYRDNDYNIYLKTPQYSIVFVEYMTPNDSKDVIYNQITEIDLSTLTQI